jgi:hypothetical protein
VVANLGGTILPFERRRPIVDEDEEEVLLLTAVMVPYRRRA